MEEDLKILIRDCQKNKRAAQAEIYRIFSARMFSVCLRYTDSYEDAQDAFQDGFIHAFHKVNQFGFKGSFEGWLRRIMVNTCIERHRKRNYFYEINEEITPDTEESIYADDNDDDFPEYTYNELLDFIRQLPDRYQQVFNLYVIDGFSHKQISEMLDISIGTSKSNLSRAREKLTQMLAKSNAVKIASK